MNKSYNPFFHRNRIAALYTLLGISVIGTSPVLAGNSPAPNNAVQSSQKNGTVTGTVTDADGNPLIGVTVIVKGTTNGVTTDIDGKFQLHVTSGDELVISYIGMKTIRQKINGFAPLKIVMNEDAHVMDEVVVTGYGNVKKSSYTGAASIMSTEKQKDLPVISMTQMMEANMPGVSLLNGNGTPGSNTSIRIRGYHFGFQ